MDAVGVVVVLGVASLGMASWLGVRRRPRRPVGPQIAEPRSLVRLLDSPLDVEAAARRAARHERDVARVAAERALHYEAMADGEADVGGTTTPLRELSREIPADGRRLA